LQIFTSLPLVTESSFRSLPLKPVIVKGLNLDPQMWGGPTLETRNPLYNAEIKDHLIYCKVLPSLQYIICSKLILLCTNSF
jgi:hypothetical protein